MLLRATIAIAVLSSCSFDTSLPPVPQSATDARQDSAIDAQVLDADPNRPDADLAVPDAATPDAEIPDAALPDAEIPDAALPDAGVPDAALPDAEICVGQELGFVMLNLDECDPLPATGPILLDQSPGFYSLNTDTGTFITPNGGTGIIANVVVSQVNGPELFVITVTDFTINEGVTLRLRGSRAFVLVATRDILIDGRMDGFGRIGQQGPGKDHPDTCGRGDNGSFQTVAGSGGGGGGFGSAGGTGGAIPTNAPTLGGSASPDLDLEPLRGGCPGGNGGNSGGGLGGAGGGAIELIAGGNITVNNSGRLTVSGERGHGVNGNFSGGGGGGSGGGILMQSRNNSIVELRVTAHGGGGGEGSGTIESTADGENGHVQNNNPAIGGFGMSIGGNGGNGGVTGPTSSLPSDGESGSTFPFAGGGGGGGAEGIVRIVVES